MSIINEALKKTEASIQKNETGKNPPVNNKPIKKPVLLYALILLIGVVAANLIFNSLNKKIVPANVAVKTTSANLNPAPAPLPAPVSLVPAEEKKIAEPKVTTEQPALILNGIFFSDNDGYALVNNQIVRENDSVDGAKVIKITVDSVKLDQEGKIITLTTRR